jgi:selenocysteine lyase/cysteine desulfurase
MLDNTLSRRTLLKGSVSAVGAVALGADVKAAAEERVSFSETFIGDSLANADNDIYWSRVADLYRVSPDIVNLENGFYGIMSKPVLAAYQRNITYLNEHNSIYLRQDYARDLDKIRAQVAAAAGVLPEEIVLTRGATESLQNLITNYALLKPGDTVMYADLDYDNAQTTIDYLQQRRGINVAKIIIPEPATYQAILDTYASAFSKYPRTKLLLLTHINNKTGLVHPVGEIANIAKDKGIDVIVDGAHSFGQIDFTIPQLNADFGAYNLHKWIGAPLGVGFIYIRKERLADIQPHLSIDEHDANDIRSRVHSGTTNTANVMTVPTALEFHHRIGAANKAARLAYLRNYWVSRVKAFNDIKILTPDDPRLYAAITSIRILGKKSKADNLQLAQRLRDQYGVFTVQRGGIDAGDCVRITPALFTRTRDLDRLVGALKDITRS